MSGCSLGDPLGQVRAWDVHSLGTSLLCFWARAPQPRRFLHYSEGLLRGFLGIPGQSQVLDSG